MMEELNAEHGLVSTIAKLLGSGESSIRLLLSLFAGNFNPQMIDNQSLNAAVDELWVGAE